MTNPNHTDTSRSGDLVERLREDGYSGHNPLCLEAADRIEALEAENALLVEERNRLVKFVNIMCDEFNLEYEGIVRQ